MDPATDGSAGFGVRNLCADLRDIEQPLAPDLEEQAGCGVGSVGRRSGYAIVKGLSGQAARRIVG